MDIRRKFDKARSIMQERGSDCLVLAPSTDLRYMIGFHGISLERPVFLILTLEKAYFVVPEFELENLSQDIRENMVCLPWKEQENPYEKARQVLSGTAITTASFGNQMQAIMYHRLQKTFPKWQWKSGGEIMGQMRSQKDEEEYKCLKIAQKRSGTALMKLLEEGIAGKTELEAALRLNDFMRKEGLVCGGTPLVAAGANGALPHHSADDTVIKEGDAVIIDFGGCYHGYYADITRTVAAGDILPEGFEEIYHIVRAANEKSAMTARPGITGEELDEAARGVIEAAGYGQYFTHRLGHGIGLDVHEEPYIVKGNKTPLMSGNVFSNEPGIYLPGRFGIRLEDVLFLHEDGAECLTELTHEILIT